MKEWPGEMELSNLEYLSSNTSSSPLRPWDGTSNGTILGAINKLKLHLDLSKISLGGRRREGEITRARGSEEVERAGIP